MLDQYLMHLRTERSFSPFTIRNYSTDILGFLDFLQHEQIDSLESVDHSVIRRYLGQLLEKGTVRASVSRKVSALRSFFRYLNAQGVVAADPLTKVTGPKRGRRLPGFLTSEEILSLLDAPDTSKPQGLRDRAILELLYASGLRVSEIASLNLSSLKLETRQVRVTGKGSKERVVLMGRPAANAVADYLELARPSLLGLKHSDALFLNRYGERVAERRIQRLIKKYAVKAGVSGRVFPHMLRHTFATHLLDGGADLRVVQELLGHANLGSTQVYTHVTRSQMRARYLEAHPRSSESRDTAGDASSVPDSSPDTEAPD